MRGSLVEKSGKYYAVFRVNGKQKWVNLQIETKGNNKRRAERALQEVLQKYLSDDYIDNNMLFVDYLDMWINQVKPLIKPSTWEGYYKVVTGKIKPYFNDKAYKLKDLKGRHFTEYFIFLKESGRSDGKGGLGKKAVLNIRGVLSSAFNYALENDMINYNFIERSRMPIFETKEFTPTIYSAEQIKTLLSYAEQTKSKACLFLYLEMFTGCRKGDDDDKIRLNQRKPSKYKGLSRFGPEKNLQRINKFMKERPTFYKKLIQMKENFRFYLRCFYCITKVVILQFNSEKQDRISS